MSDKTNKNGANKVSRRSVLKGAAATGGLAIGASVIGAPTIGPRISRTSRSNCVSGNVIAIEYQGTYVKITLHAPDNHEFVVHVPDHIYFAQPIAVGDGVVASWQASAVHHLADDHGRVEAESNLDLAS